MWQQRVQRADPAIHGGFHILFILQGIVGLVEGLGGCDVRLPCLAPHELYQLVQAQIAELFVCVVLERLRAHFCDSSGLGQSDAKA